MGKIIAICISKEKGTQKQNIETANFIANFGVENDAHGGNWHRQVSLLSYDRIQNFNDLGADVSHGAFGENLIVEGIDFKSLPVGTQLNCNDVVLEISQIGKECHSHCAIFQKMGDCIMPREGVFARVLQSGKISTGDEMTITPPSSSRPFQAAVITLSDSSSVGKREDKSGPYIVNRLKENGYDIVEHVLIPDDGQKLKENLIRLCDSRQVDLILTTGGTGFAPRDITPEITLSVATKNAPGIAEAIRMKSLSITPRAMLSRSASVIRNNTLIINLPGSPKACAETMDVFMDVIPHGIELLRDTVFDCQRK